MQIGETEVVLNAGDSTVIEKDFPISAKIPEMYPQKAFLPFRRRCGDGWIWYIKATVCIQKPDGPALNLNF